MLTILYLTTGLIAVLSLAGWVIYRFFPGVLVRSLQSMAAYRSGLKRRSVNVDGYESHFFEGGAGKSDTLILLHGLGDDKNSFVSTVSRLTRFYRVVLPDLAAHGENALEEGRNYSIRGQVDFVDGLLTALKADRFTIGGNSMGGHVAAAYAYRHPDKVGGLVLINATGTQQTDESVYLYYPDVVDREYFDSILANVFANEPSMPDVVVNYMIRELQPKIKFLNALVAEVENGEDFRMNEKAEEIKAPTLLLWGREDPVVPIAYAEIYHEKIPNSELTIMENAGHSPQFEIPQVLQQEIARFLRASLS